MKPDVAGETHRTVSLKTSVPGPASVDWMRRREASLPRGVGHLTPFFIASGSGAVITDVDGNRLIDFAGGIGCLNVGHAAPVVVHAIERQAQKFLHGCVHVTPNDSYVRLAEALNSRTPGGGPKKTLLTNSGAEAVENAVKIARASTGRPAVIAAEDGFHGRTLLGLSLTSKTHPYKAGFGPYAPEIYRMRYPYPYRDDSGMSASTCAADCIDHLESMFRRVIAAEQVAAVIVEPLLGEGGFVVPPADYFPMLAAVCRRHGILLIVDEIQTGIGRTGTLFASEQLNVIPDLILSGKSLGGGLPIAAVTGRAEVMDAAPPGGLGGTYGGNPVACEAALAVLQMFDEARLGERATQIGKTIERVSRSWPTRFALIGEQRGMGAMRAIEFVRDRVSKEPAAEETSRIVRACHARGLIVIPAGTFANVIRFLVPLTITDGELLEGLGILEEAIEEVSADN